jgi:hypothetical protein
MLTVVGLHAFVLQPLEKLRRERGVDAYSGVNDCLARRHHTLTAKLLERGQVVDTRVLSFLDRAS